METWKPVIEVLIQPAVAATIGGIIAYWAVNGIKAAAPGLSVEVKIASAFATSAIIGVGTEALTVIVDGKFEISKVVAYLLSQWLVATLGHVAVAKPLKAQKAKNAAGATP